MGKSMTGGQGTGDSGLWHQAALMNLLADVLMVLAVAGLGWAGLTALQRLPVFPLRELVLTAVPDRVTPEQLEHAAREAMIGNFFTVDLEAARAAFEKLPWVRKAAVSREWPDGLKLTLEENEPVARWRHLNGDHSLVNRQGELFFAELPGNAPELPQLSGPAGSARELLERFAEFSGVLAGIGRRIESIALSPRRAWQLKLDDGVAVELGRDQSREQTGERLERFVTHYAALRQQVGAVRVADMRYPNGFVLSGLERGGSLRGGLMRGEAAGRKL